MFLSWLFPLLSVVELLAVLFSVAELSVLVLCVFELLVLLLLVSYFWNHNPLLHNTFSKVAAKNLLLQML